MMQALAEYREIELTVLEAMRPDLGEAEFELVALQVQRYQAENNAPYARWCAARPEPKRWQEIPAVPQSAFKRFPLSVLPDHIGTTFLTSGTTSDRRGQHHFIDPRLYVESVRRGWALFGPAAARHLILTPPPEQAPGSSLAHMMGVLAGLSADARFFVNGDGQLAADALLSALESAVRAREPVGMLGTALAFLNFFERMGARRLALPPGSFAMETGGFKGSGRDIAKAELYAMFAETLGLKQDEILNEYGMTELSSQFYTRGLGRPHSGPPWLRALVIDPESGTEVLDGGTGFLRIFDLANTGSVLAIDTQDLAVRRGDEFELLGRDPAALPRGCSRAADELMRRP